MVIPLALRTFRICLIALWLKLYERELRRIVTRLQMSLIKKYAANEKLESDGVWFDYKDDPNADGSIPGFLVGRYSRLNKRFRKHSSALAEKHRDEIEDKSLDEATDDRLGLELFIDGALFDWRNVQPNDDGVNLPYGRDNAIELLGNLAPHLLDDLRKKANRASNYRAKELEKNAKN